MTEDFLTLYADPGEDFGWAIGCGTTLLARGITKMWITVDMLWDELIEKEYSEFRDEVYWRGDHDPANYQDHLIQRVVCENFRIYPWAAKDLAWDEVRTARAIGAMYQICRRADVKFITQPAAIKEAAKAAGAEELFDRPLYENRHSNDAVMHYVWFTSTELMGLKMVAPGQSEDNQ